MKNMLISQRSIAIVIDIPEQQPGGRVGPVGGLRAQHVKGGELGVPAAERARHERYPHDATVMG